jgi:hypothetical protein
MLVIEYMPLILAHLLMPGWLTGLQVAYVQTVQAALDGRRMYIVREGGAVCLGQQ